MKAESKVYFTVEHLFWDTSIKETPPFTKFGPGKMFSNLCICYLYRRNSSIQGKGTFSLGPEIQF